MLLCCQAPRDSCLPPSPPCNSWVWSCHGFLFCSCISVSHKTIKNSFQFRSQITESLAHNLFMHNSFNKMIDNIKRPKTSIDMIGTSYTQKGGHLKSQCVNSAKLRNQFLCYLQSFAGNTTAAVGHSMNTTIECGQNRPSYSTGLLYYYIKALCKSGYTF